MALTAERDTKQMGDLPQARTINVPVKASTKIYKGGMVGIDSTGYAVPMSAALGLVCIGKALHTKDNTSGSNGDLTVDVDQGVFWYANGDTITAAMAGSDCYASDDQTVNVSDGGQARSFAGRIIAVDATLGVAVLMGLHVRPQADGLGPVVLSIDLADIANGSIAKITPKAAGRIRGFAAVVEKAATTAAKAATITPQIGPVGGAYTSVTGGALALTSANMTPIGAEVDASAITAANAFTAAQQINLLASAVTAFVEGRVALILWLGK